MEGFTFCIFFLALFLVFVWAALIRNIKSAWDHRNFSTCDCVLKTQNLKTGSQFPSNITSKGRSVLISYNVSHKTLRRKLWSLLSFKYFWQHAKFWKFNLGNITRIVHSFSWGIFGQVTFLTLNISIKYFWLLHSVRPSFNSALASAVRSTNAA